MKKVLKFTIGLILTVSFLLLAVACGSSSNLSTPANLVINDELILSWAAVENARSYRIEIVEEKSGDRVESVAQRVSYDLSKLAEGDYNIRVRAVGGSRNDVFSDWSERTDFHRDKESGLLYTLINGNTEYEVKSVGSASGDLVIEDVYRGKPVTGIGQTAFRNSTKLTSVVIPDSITYIGASAFYNCTNLVSVTIPETVTTIGRSAFQQCSSLTKINIPQEITTIEPFTFAYCRALERLTLNENLISIGESAFSNCSSLVELEIPDSVQTINTNAFQLTSHLEKVTFGSGLETIGKSAFYNCNSLETLTFNELTGELTIGSYAFALDTALKNVALPKGVTSIEMYSFASAVALENITIPASVTSIEPYAFYNTKLYNDQMQSGDGVIYADKWIVDATDEFKTTVNIFGDEGKEDEIGYFLREGTVGIADAAFRYTWVVQKEDKNGELKDVTEYVSCENLKRIRFPSSLKYVGEAAFYHAPNLQRLLATYDNSLVSVGSYAFALCPKLNNVQFARGLREIDTRAFFQCELLDYIDNNPELIIPSTVTRVGENAFFGTTLWDRKDITDGVVYAGNWVVGYHIDKTENDQNDPSRIVELRENTVGICDYAFYGDQALQNITGLNKVTTIGKGAFAWCTKLSAVNLNQNLRVIEDYTFYKCKSIFSVTFPTMLQSIGKDAFYQCEQLNEIDLLGTQVTTIKDSAFRECKGLRSVDLGEKIQSIGKYAFYGCRLLMELEIPDSVTTMGVRAFGNCLSLNSLKIGSGLEEISDYAFSNCIWLRNLELPANIQRVGNYAFYGCKRLQSLTIQEGVEEIGHYAFYGNEKLTHVEFPASVNSIGVYAFKDCALLTSVLFKGEPNSVNENAFYGCQTLTLYGVGEGVGENWSALWNSSQRPAVWGVTLSEDGSYVESIKIGDITYPHARFGYTGPAREGYVFVGWSTKKGAATAEYTAAQLEYIPAGTTVYSVWEEEPYEDDDDSWFEEWFEWFQDMIEGELQDGDGWGDDSWLRPIG